MKSHLQLTNRAFAFLEFLPERIAFEVFTKLDRLTEFPLMGSPLEIRFPKLKGFRQIIHDKKIRIIYEFDQYENTIYVLSILDCRQEIPHPRELKRDQLPETGLPLE